MSIDWPTVAAQIVNFLILAFLLYKFLYKPLLVAIAKREQHIADELQHSEDLAKEAEKKLDELNKRYLAIDNERSRILDDARQEAKELKEKLEHEIHSEVLEKKLLWQQELDREKALMISELRQQVVANFLEFARKALKRMADEKLESRFLSVFERQLEDMPEKDKRFLTADTDDVPITVSTSEELTPAAQEALKKMMISVLEIEDEPEFIFEVNPRLLCGIEFSVNGNVVSWNLDDYLNSFTTKMNEALENISVRLGREES